VLIEAAGPAASHPIDMIQPRCAAGAHAGIVADAESGTRRCWRPCALAGPQGVAKSEAARARARRAPDRPVKAEAAPRSEKVHAVAYLDSSGGLSPDGIFVTS